MTILNLFKKEKSAAEPEVDKPAPESKNEGQMTDVCSEVAQDTKRVHNLIVLDESGSMQSIYHPALTGVNETLHTIREAQKEHGDQKHYVSLIAFDSGHYNRIYNNTAAEMAVDITADQYRPGGCTPLFDAMGRAITELRTKVKKGDVVLVTVITDGYENASQEYDGKAIKSLVEAMKAEGWVFTYIGANQDVAAVAASMSIDNHLAFEADDASTCAMFAKENSSRRAFFSRVSACGSIDNLAVGYFDSTAPEKKEDDEDEFPF